MAHSAIQGAGYLKPDSKILVTGARGQLGAELCQQLGARAVGLSHAELDIADREAVMRVVRDVRPAAVINSAAYTKVDLAEKESEQCRAINATAVQYLAEACAEVDCHLVEISTDYVFGSADAPHTPHVESDPVAPQGVYARTKHDGDLAAAAYARHTIVRTCGLYGHPDPAAKAPNFVDTMLRLGRERPVVRVVGDQHCTPSYVRHVARAVLFLADGGHRGLFHVTNRGATTWHDLAGEIFHLAKLPVKLEQITTAEYGAPAPRPSWSVLDTSKYHALGGPTMADWRDAVAEYLAARGVI